MVALYDDRALPKVIDFGVAKALMCGQWFEDCCTATLSDTACVPIKRHGSPSCGDFAFRNSAARDSVCNGLFCCGIGETMFWQNRIDPDAAKSTKPIN